MIDLSGTMPPGPEFLGVSAAAAERFADAVATCGLFAPDAVSEAQW